MSDSKIAKIKALADDERAPEGERAAAREALKRMEAAAPGITEVDSASGYTPPPRPVGIVDLGDMADPDGMRLRDIADKLIEEEFARLFGPEQSKAKHHHGRVWFDRS